MNPKGFAWLPILIILVVALAVVGGGGYYVLHQNTQQNYAPSFGTSESTTTTATSTTAAPNSFCGNFANLKQGDTDATTGGKVTQLQKFLGVSPTTGSYGARTEIAYTNECVGGNTSPTSVPGMSKYTDSNFGFSFWYPSGWTVSKQTIVQNSPYPDGTVIGEFILQSGANTDENITIDEVSSSNSSVTISSDMQRRGMQIPDPIKFYFDSSRAIWMMEYPEGVRSNYDGSIITPPGTKHPALTKGAENTVGGLHLLQAFNVDVVPLSATNFLVITSYSYGSLRIDAVAWTAGATDLSVATPLSSNDQKHAIVKEGLLLGALGNSIEGYWYSYDGAIYDSDGGVLSNAGAATFHQVEADSGFATDGVHVWDSNRVIDGADPATFTIVHAPDGSLSEFEKDKNHVYDGGTVILGADPATFTIVIDAKQPNYTEFQKDSTRVWHDGKIISGADPATFSIVNQPLWQSALFQIDASHVWYEGLLIPGADPKTFMVDSLSTSGFNFTMHDANHSYQLLNGLGVTSSTTLKIDGGAPMLLQ